MNKLKAYPFFAMIGRLKLINRWSLMQNTQLENVQEHSHQVAVIAHALAVIRQKKFGEGRLNPDPAQVALMALYHDASEVITGDLPTPIKYYNPEIKNAYKQVEKTALNSLVNMLPEELADEFSSILVPDEKDELIIEAEAIVKAADKISALIKCTEEINKGNRREFSEARNSIVKACSEYNMPELNYFIDNFLPAYEMSIDSIKLLR